MKINVKIIFMVVLAVVVSTAALTEEKVQLKLELPKALFDGTPKDIKSSNMERPGTPAVKVMVPKGTTNIAAKAKVTSSDDFPVIGELEYITDGDKDGADGSYVELGPSEQWVLIDLGAQKTLYAVAVWHYHKQPCAYRDVIIQLADDEDFTQNVKTLYNNDHDNSSGKGIGKDKEYIETNAGRLIAAKGFKARFVRLYSKGSTNSDMNHYIEVEVYGK